VSGLTKLRKLCLPCIGLLLQGAFAASAQTPALPDGQGAALSMVVLSGEGARHSIKSRRGQPIQIEVRDTKGQILAGAQVVFLLPSAGPGGTFPGGRLTQRVTTNPQGQAWTSGFAPNDQSGRFNVKVTVTSGELTTSQVVSQINVIQTEADTQKSSHKALWILLAAGAAGGIGAALALGGGGGAAQPASPPPSLTLIPGVVTVGGPR